MKQNVKLILMPLELLFLALIAFVTTLGLSVYLFLCVVVELFRRGMNYGFRRDYS
tara:strand:+ start:728 stop:892 length:165 start_codon:yes stop_codon:yes gene_type:complete